MHLIYRPIMLKIQKTILIKQKRLRNFKVNSSLPSLPKFFRLDKGQFKTPENVDF